MRVVGGFGERRTVETIASDIEHLGNKVAEGDMHPSLFWPELARLKAGAERRAHTLLAAERKAAADARFAAEARWQEDFLVEAQTRRLGARQ